MTVPITRDEVWLVNLDPTIGDEIRKIRPAVAMSRDAIGILALRVVVPITAWQDRFQSCDWLVRLTPDHNNGLDKVSAADAFQVRSISAQRCVRRVGRLSDIDVQRVAEAIRIVFEI